VSVRARGPKGRPPAGVTGSAPAFVGPARPRVVMSDYNVYEAALDRIRWVFSEFDNRVMVCNSGGKDSTVVLELALIVARERNALPLHVQWLDQECEFQSTVDYQRHLMYERTEEIDFHWYQVPFYLENATNTANPFLYCWDPDHPELWVRPKEPGSIHENVYGEIYFNEMLSAINGKDWDGALLDGIRSEESPARRLTAESAPMYKWATWSVIDAKHGDYRDPRDWRYRFHPIYDWRVWDVWKAIHDNHWKYNRHYDHLFQRGTPVRKMRVSNYHHDQALGSLLLLQEVEPETWEAATRRLEGINTYGHIGKDQYPDELPYMFKSWEEYLLYLIDNLVPEDAMYRGKNQRLIFLDQYRRLREQCPWDEPETIQRQMVKAVIGGDPYGTQLNNYLVTSRHKHRIRMLHSEEK
jgi:predicted phosphoadenosine phosphosulfate sulfurtransferase